jgi:hypothetical protein
MESLTIKAVALGASKKGALQSPAGIILTPNNTFGVYACICLVDACTIPEHDIDHAFVY